MLACLLGFRRRPKGTKARHRFLGLALILAIRTLTRRWKSPKAPTVQVFQEEMVLWGGAEGRALKREEDKNLRTKPISLDWNIMLEDLKRIDLTLSQTQLPSP